MRAYRVTYDRVTRQVVKSLPCPKCGKKVRRQRTFGQTVNPFNCNDDGTVKTWAEVDKAVAAQASEWLNVPEVCTKCQDGDS